MLIMIREFVVKGLKNPQKIPAYIRYLITRRVPFTFESVTDGWGDNGKGLPSFSARLYQETTLLQEAIGKFKATKSLEIGCGYGRLTPWIAEFSEKHYAIEPEIQLLKTAKKLYPSVTFYSSKAQALPFPDDYFDLCVTWTVLQHLPKTEMIKAIVEIKRVCAQKALIIIAEGVGKRRGIWYWEHPLGAWKELFQPWELTWYKERKIEKSFTDFAGLIMKFEQEK